MKKVFLFFLTALAISFSACVDMNDPVEENSTYLLELNGTKYHNGDTIKCLTGQNFRVSLLENGIASQATFIFGNGASDISGYQAFVTYSGNGTYTLRAEKGAIITRVYIVVGALPTYTLKINNQTVGNDSTFRIMTGTKLGFKVVDADGRKMDVAYDFGNGQKVTTDSVAITYAKGTYVLKAVVGSTTIRANIIVSDEETSGEAIILISASTSNTTVNAVIGLRCNAIAGIDTTKDVYVAGEIPGVSWRDYNIGHKIVYINKTPYFKWEITAVTGNFRLSFIQLKSGKTEFKYDNCTWAYVPASKYWNVEGLFRFTTYIEGGVAKIKP